MRRLIFVAVLMFLVFPVMARGELFPVISAANIQKFQSVAQVDFDDISNELGKFDSGWLAVSTHGEYFATVNRENTIIVWDSEGNERDRYSILGSDGLPATFVDADFSELVWDNFRNTLASLHRDGEGYYVVLRFVDSHYKMQSYRFLSPDIPVRIWILDRTSIDVELLPNNSANGSYIQSLLTYDEDFQPGDEPLAVYTNPSASSRDTEAVVRIGHVEPPRTVTVTQEGVVKRWIWSFSDRPASIAQVDGLPAAGNLNASGSHLAWRDPESKALHLLNFETGEDKVVAPLDGQYLQFMFLTLNADVIIGVNIDLQPVVVAWDVATGQRYDLGEYRQCSRVPDMARLSKDGTTLVIGCDTGLDIWRVVKD